MLHSQRIRKGGPGWLPVLTALIVVAGCNSGSPTASLPASQGASSDIIRPGESQASQQAAQPTGPAASGTPAPIAIWGGGIVGLDNTFSPVDGDTSSGGHGDPVYPSDPVPCDNSSIYYHIHAHVSLIVSGKRLAVPDAIGLHDAGTESKGFTFATMCYYHLHTHDASGLVHVEAPAHKTYTLGQFFAIWGQPLSSSAVAGYTGTVKVYLATAPTPGYHQTGPYSLYTGDPQTLTLDSHEEIVLEVGPTFVDPPNLPAIVFQTTTS